MTARHASGLAASGGIECRLTNRRQSQRTGGNSVIRAVALLAVILIGLTGCGSSSKNQSGDTGGEPGAGTVVSDAPPANLDPSVRDVIYGGRDSTIPAAWTDRALTRACQMGDVIQIAYWPDQGHQQIDPVAALGWLNDRFKSIPSANDRRSTSRPGIFRRFKLPGSA